MRCLADPSAGLAILRHPLDCPVYRISANRFAGAHILYTAYRGSRAVLSLDGVGRFYEPVGGCRTSI